MNPALLTFLGAAVGALAAFGGVLATGLLAAKREREARNYEAKAKVYASLLQHIDELRATSFSDHAAFAAFSEDPDRLLLARRLPWYLDMEVRAPDNVRIAADNLIGTLVDLGLTRESAWNRLGQPGVRRNDSPAESVWDRFVTPHDSSFAIETDSEVEAVREKFNAERTALVELIRRDLRA